MGFKDALGSCLPSGMRIEVGKKVGNGRKVGLGGCLGLGLFFSQMGQQGTLQKERWFGWRFSTARQPQPGPWRWAPTGTTLFVPEWSRSPGITSSRGKSSCSPYNLSTHHSSNGEGK